MYTHEDKREIEVLRERIARLCAAMKHINASLDPHTVLREILMSARALTGAAYGVIVTVDDAGEAGDFTSSGITEEEHQRLSEWPGGPKLFAHFRDLPGPLRLPDVPAYVRALGFAPWIPAKAFLGTPMRHRGAHVGSFFLTGKDGGGEFTDEDEEILTPLASQAAIAIANARAHRAEQLARANLEVLVETSPVGVVVFDAGTGQPTSLNLEAKRIVESLRTAGRSAEQLLEVLTCRFADGREIALDELPMAQVLEGAAEPIRAEEIQLSVPDGRSVAVLVNSTPIRTADGGIESVVVAMQDLAPLEEIDRMRAEFLGTVSHELRAPLAAIKGSAATALGTSRELDPGEARQFFAIVNEQADHMDRLIHDLLDVGRIETGILAVALESTDVAVLVDRARSTFISGGARHELAIDLPPDLPRVMADRRRIAQVLGNLLANAAKHSPELSPIRISAERDGGHIAVSVADDGAGLAPEELARLFRKHGGDGTNGRRRSGLGLVICKGLVEAHGGRIRAESGGPGRGTRFTFTVPVADFELGDAAAQGAPATSRVAPTPILVVDDDPQTLRQLRDTLADAGYAPIVTGVHTGLTKIIEAEKPRLVLLDLMLPGTDGIELMRTVPALAELPVIFISAYGRDETVARALDSGALDYIVKPFSPAELTARIRVALRRRDEPESFRLGDLAIDYGDRRVTLAGRHASLTSTEYEVLRLLSLRPGRLLTNAQLLDSVWGETGAEGTARLRTIIKKLRRKLGDDAGNPTWIFSERGVGYRLARPKAD